MRFSVESIETKRIFGFGLSICPLFVRALSAACPGLVRSVRADRQTIHTIEVIAKSEPKNAAFFEKTFSTNCLRPYAVLISTRVVKDPLAKRTSPVCNIVSQTAQRAKGKIAESQVRPGTLFPEICRPPERHAFPLCENVDN